MVFRKTKMKYNENPIGINPIKNQRSPDLVLLLPEIAAVTPHQKDKANPI